MKPKLLELLAVGLLSGRTLRKDTTNIARMLVLLLIGLPGPAWSTVVFSNFGPGDSHSNLAYFLHNNNYLAMDFVPSASGALTSLRLPVDVIFGTPTGDLFISLRPPGADPTGAALEAWVLPLADVIPFPGIRIEVLTSLLNPHLSTGSAYWLLLETTTTNAGTYLWTLNSTGDLGLASSNNQGSTWSHCADVCVSAAFEVNATVAGGGGNIPEPSTWALVMTGVLCLFLRRRFRIILLQNTRKAAPWRPASRCRN